MNERRLAATLMLVQGCLFAGETAAIHHIGVGATIMQLAMLRGLAGIVLVLSLARGRGVAIVRTRQLPLQLLRGAVTALYSWILVYAFGRLPFADATAISYTQAIYIAAFSALILHEQVSRLRWIAAFMGPIGALLIVRPTFSVWDLGHVVVVLGTGLNGLAFVLNRYLQRPGGDTDLTTMFYVNVVAVVCNVPVLVELGSGSCLPPSATFPWLLGVLLLGPLGTYAGIAASRHAPASALGPYTLLRLVIGVAGGIVVFNEMPDVLNIIGIAVILVSCALPVLSDPRVLILWSLPFSKATVATIGWQRAERGGSLRAPFGPPPPKSLGAQHAGPQCLIGEGSHRATSRWLT